MSKSECAGGCAQGRQVCARNWSRGKRCTLNMSSGSECMASATVSLQIKESPR